MSKMKRIRAFYKLAKKMKNLQMKIENEQDEEKKAALIKEYESKDREFEKYEDLKETLEPMCQQIKKEM